MNLAETAAVLAKAAAFDQRTIGEADVLAWHEILCRTGLADALEAVRVYYAESRERIMPADVRKLAVTVREQRQARLRQDERRLAIEAGTRDRSAEVSALVESVAAALPRPDSHAKAVTRARRERGRPVERPAAKRKPKPKSYPPPMTDDVAALATRYLLDGHDPAAVAEKLGVSRRWCEKTARRVRPEETT